ncbi:MAG: DUF2959 family protein, partial [Planctomycetota bacterium]|nr:DUF2959 family protein [Planctomycetota bacterium]
QTTVHEAFEAFEKSIEGSVDQHASFRSAVTSLQGDAKPFFEGWSTGLESFNSQTIRIQSRKRMEETRTTYDRIVLSSETPLVRLQEFNTALKDVALFLSRDFNASSVRMIEGELRSLIQIAGDLDSDFAKCLENCKGYSEASGLPARVQVQEVDQEGTEETSKK